MLKQDTKPAAAYSQCSLLAESIRIWIGVRAPCAVIMLAHSLSLQVLRKEPSGGMRNDKADIGKARNERIFYNEKPPAVSCRGFFLEKCQTIRIRSYAERER